MRLNSSSCAKALLLAVALSGAVAAEPNVLTTQESADGWRLLFDGKSFAGWTGMRGYPLPTRSWQVEDGMIRTTEDRVGGDLRTVEVFDDYELSWEWKISERGNSGVKYVVQEDWPVTSYKPGHDEARKEQYRRFASGFEYQISDDTRWDKSKPGWEKSACGALYLLYPAQDKTVKPVGEWNTSRIVVRGNHAEHWLNGKKVVEFEMGSADLLERVTHTKFRTLANYGTKGPGPIVLQHHGSPAWFRNIKIRTF